MNKIQFIAALLSVLLLSGCSAFFTPISQRAAPSDKVLHKDKPLFTQVEFTDLPGYRHAKTENILISLIASCHHFDLMKKSADIGTDFLPLRANDWQQACGYIERYIKQHNRVDKNLFETLFTPYHVTSEKLPNGLGLFTGYYEAELKASRQKSSVYRYPIYKRPPDLKESQPYLTRAQINEGGLANNNLELFWAKDPLDIFILQIQGSGKINLDDGTLVRISYHGHNGHSYRSIGQKLIRDGKLKPSQADWQGIRQWLLNNPKKSNETLNHNKRYVFFRISEHQKSIVGAQETPLIAGRSLATDLRYIPLGSLLWVNIENIAGEKPKYMRRFMIAQDTGSAIRGVIRGDFFWGSGKYAAHNAGKMKNRGSYYILLPKIAARRIAKKSKYFRQ